MTCLILAGRNSEAALSMGRAWFIYGHTNATKQVHKRSEVPAFSYSLTQMTLLMAECGEDSLADRLMNERALLKVCCRCQPRAGCKVSQPRRQPVTQLPAVFLPGHWGRIWLFKTLSCSTLNTPSEHPPFSLQLNLSVAQKFLSSSHRAQSLQTSPLRNPSCYCHFAEVIALCTNFI